MFKFIVQSRFLVAIFNYLQGIYTTSRSTAGMQIANEIHQTSCLMGRFQVRFQCNAFKSD